MSRRKLTNRQFDVMNVLWSAGKPMIASEIVDAKSSLNTNTVRSVLKILLDKQFIEIADIVYSGTVLAKQYRVVVTKEEYFINMCKEDQSGSSTNILVALINEEKDLRVLEDLEKIIRDAKEELKGE